MMAYSSGVLNHYCIDNEANEAKRKKRLTECTGRMKRAAGTLSGSAPTHLGDFLRVTQGAYLVADQFAAQAAVNNRASILGRAIFRSPPPAMRTTSADAATAPHTGASAAEIATPQVRPCSDH